MDGEVVDLGQHLVRKLNQIPEPGRILVGIAGIPASGKSTFSRRLVDYLNHYLGTLDTQSSRAVLVGLDGWHYTRAQLDRFPEPKLAHDRRGSHWTFDSTAYVDFVRLLCEETGDDTTLSAPSFDHSLKDPTPNIVIVHPYHRIVIIEGLYVFLALEPWKKAGMMLDERCLIQVDPTEARKRLVSRHVLTGVAKDLAEADWRADENDMPNGHFLLANSLEPTRVIQSKDDHKFASSTTE